MRLPTERPPIRKGQYWKKKDSGEIMRITSSRGGDNFVGEKFIYKDGTMRRFNHSHGVNRKDLWLFWQRI